MELIPKEYLVLFNAITAAEESLQKLRQELIRAQQISEELYIERTGKEPEDPPKSV